MELNSHTALAIVRRTVDLVVRVDCSTISFVTPGGLAALLTMTARLVATGRPVAFDCPQSVDVARYMSRMGLGACLDHLGVGSDLPAVTHHDRAEHLLECEFIEDEALEGLSELVMQRMDEAGVHPLAVDELATHVHEVAGNVRIHAGSGGGFVCAQSYERGTPRERVVIAVADPGAGIPATLSRRHRFENDQAALQLATQLRVSGREGDRGLGLHYLVRDIPGAGGKVTLRSGNAIRTVYPRGPYSTSGAAFPGTLVEIDVKVAGFASKGVAR